MTLVSTTFPADGTTIDASDVNIPFTAILAAVNGHVDATNITAGSLPWSVMGSFTNTIPASAMQDSGNVEVVTKEQFNDVIISGVLINAATLSWTVSAGFARIQGKRITVNAASGTLAANSDIYFSLDNNGNISSTGSNTVANNTASPTLPANSLWVGVVVTNATAASTITQTVRSAGPIVGFVHVVTHTTQGDPIYPTKATSTLRLWQPRTSSTSTGSSTAEVLYNGFPTGFNFTAIAGRIYKLSIMEPSFSGAAGSGNNNANFVFYVGSTRVGQVSKLFSGINIADYVSSSVDWVAPTTGYFTLIVKFANPSATTITSWYGNADTGGAVGQALLKVEDVS